MASSTTASHPTKVQIPKRLGKGRCRLMSRGLIMLDWLFLAIIGFLVAFAVVALSVISAMI